MVLSQTPPTSRPLRADARRNREAIVAAADDLFRSDGMALQMEEVAQRAGLGVGTVYRHFPTKEALTVELVQCRTDTVIGRAERTMDACDPATALRRFILDMAAMMSDDVGLRESFQVQVLADNQLDACVYFRQDLHERKMALVRRAQDAGVVRGDLALEDFDALMCGMGQAILAGGNPVLVADVLLEGMHVPRVDAADVAAAAGAADMAGARGAFSAGE
ncbi:transcriptional regulator, TetR family [Catenulispora acidiphila DSM 44928]|uniref:Transcriptional regulator, TetR family n=1 Tax=Catenulispora acidiphila (strain DSM 44928 / JCM 14897 / NBRC 102108 / NRRL B-24433 / ID139908) TaxID=479433 RepID=C7Q1F5_CATAD|nr:TetR/AcrR family transcriptional regulator [Catenulispora acidiphila]ACU73684.1 transcriptional regulator, TetR family [Catenulispora acidiphila DSM 44928]